MCNVHPGMSVNAICAQGLHVALRGLYQRNSFISLEVGLPDVVETFLCNMTNID